MIHQINSLSKLYPDIQDMETQASPSLISIKQSDLRIVIDDFPEDESEPSSPTKQKDPVFIIEKMIEEIKHVSKKKRVVGDLCEYYTCHSCRTVLEKKYLIHCTEQECLRYFCLRCSNKRYNLLPEGIYEIMKLEDWNCFSCQGLCNCKICKERFSDRSAFLPPFGNSASNDNRRLDITTKLEPSEAGNAFRVPNMNAFIGRTEGFDENGYRSGLANSQSGRTPKARIRKPQDGEIQDQTEDQININMRMKNKKPKPNKRRLSSRKIKRTKGRCHLCGNRPADSPLLTCSVKSCKIQFCSPCAKEHFEKDFPDNPYVPRTWECYSCKGGCKCAECIERKLQQSQMRRPRSKVVGTVVDGQIVKPNAEAVKRTKSRNSNKRFTAPSSRPQTRKVLVIDDSNISIKVEDTIAPFPKAIPAVPSYDSSEKKDPEVITLDKRDIDDSRIISEISIDSAFITLYDAENEEQLMNEFQQKKSQF